MRNVLADLDHSQPTARSDTYPLGGADLATFVRQCSRARERMEVRIFPKPQDLDAAIALMPLEILGSSGYSRNHLSLCSARHAKAGGKEERLRRLPPVDLRRSAAMADGAANGCLELIA